MYTPEKDTIRIGIIGIGSMGKGLLYQSHITPGIQCVAVCDMDIQRCINILNVLNLPYQIVANQDEMDKVINRNLIAICNDGLLISKSESVQVVVEASSSIGPVWEFAITALQTHKHLALMNSELDLTFGPLLAKLAEDNGVIFTSCDGDQHGVLKHLIDEIKLWGFELVMAGNIKGFLDRYANPTTIIPEADKRNLDYRMCTAYTDGTKLNIEMAILANAEGLITKTPGMYGPRANHVTDVFHYFDFNSLWEDRHPFVDYILGAEPGGGVFVIGYCDNPFQRDMLSYYKMGKGPYYLFYRPYHLCHIEAINTLIRCIRENHSFLAPEYGLRTNVYAYAKRKISKGEQLDGVGGYTCYGKIENLIDNMINPGLPIYLADNVVAKYNIEKDQKILMDDIYYDSKRSDFKLYNDALKIQMQYKEKGSV